MSSQKLHHTHAPRSQVRHPRLARPNRALVHTTTKRERNGPNKSHRVPDLAKIWCSDREKCEKWTLFHWPSDFHVISKCGQRHLIICLTHSGARITKIWTMSEFRWVGSHVLQKGTTSRESFDATKYSHVLKGTTLSFGCTATQLEFKHSRWWYRN